MCKRITDKREKKKYAVFALFAFLFAASVFFFSGKTEVRAGPLDNAIDYYNTYGEKDVHFDRSRGYLYFFSRGHLSSSGTKYHTLGWQALVLDSSGRIVDMQYLKLGGKIEQIDGTSPDGWSYELYRINAKVLYDGFSWYGQAVLNNPDSQIRLNAGNCVKVNGVDQGWMSDGNAGSGVYYTYDGIDGAVGWSDTTHEALKSYYDKQVPDMFFNVQVETENGAINGSGGGRYMWGSYATVSCGVANGYSFSNWHDRFSGAQKSTNTSYRFRVTGDTYLMATGQGNTYKLSYDANGGSGAPGSQSYTYGPGAIRLSGTTPYREGYDFLGWSSSRYATSPSWSPNSDYGKLPYDSTVYAVWKIKRFKVRTYSGRGIDGTYGDGTYNWGTNVTVSADVREGYHFDHWESGGSVVSSGPNSNGPTKVSYTFTLKNNIDLTAVAKPNTYYIYFNSNTKNPFTGVATTETVTNMPGTQKYVYDSGDVTLPDNIPVRYGYDFKGWSTSPDTTKAAWLNGDWYENIPRSQTLYAVWARHPFVQTNNFYKETNGNWIWFASTKHSVLYLDYYTNTNENVKTPRGYHWWMFNTVGWTVTADKNDRDGYGYYLPNTYTIKYVDNGATSGSMRNGADKDETYTDTLKYDVPYTLSAVGYQRKGYHFLGWATSKENADAKLVSYTDKNPVLNLTDEDHATIYLYAVWEPNTYYVKYLGNGATSGGVASQVCKYDTSYTYRANEGPGFKFQTQTSRSLFRGWSSEENGNGEYGVVNPGDLFSNLTDEDQATIYLYAQWEQDNNDYIVKVYPNGGIITKDGTNHGGNGTPETNGTYFTVVGKYGSTFDLNVSKKTVNNKKYFDQWTMDNVDALSDTSHPDFTFRGRIQGNGTLVANWVNKVTITVKPNGGIVNGHTEDFIIEGKATDPFILDFSFCPLTLQDVTFTTNGCATTNCIYTKSKGYYNSKAGTDYYGYDALTIDSDYQNQTVYSYRSKLAKCKLQAGAYTTNSKKMLPNASYPIGYASYSMVKNGTITVNWVQKNAPVYKITLDNNTGTGGDKEFYEKYNVGFFADKKTSLCINSVTEIPQKEGYQFLGYYTTKNSGGTQVVDEDGNIIVSKTFFSSDSTIYARWQFTPPPDTPYTVEQYLPVIDPNTGAESYSDTPTERNEYLGYAGKAIKVEDLARSDDIYSGYKFLYATKDGSKISTFNVEKGITIKLYYTGKYFQVTTNRTEGITNVGTWGAVTIVQDGIIYYKVGTYVKVTASLDTGYEFATWTSTSNGIAGSSDNPYQFTMPGNDVVITAYAKTDDTIYNITYDLDGGTVTSPNPVLYKKTTPTFSLNEPEKDNAKFLGWTGTELTGPTKDVTIATGSTGNREYKANWAWNKYKIILDSSMDGKPATTAGTEYYYEQYSVGNFFDSACQNKITDDTRITIPTRRGYTFLGYYDKLDAAGSTDPEKYIDETGHVLATSTTFTEDTTLYAMWEANTYKITLDNQGADRNRGTGTYFEKYDDGNYTTKACETIITDIKLPVKTGYNFGGYFTEKNGKGKCYINSAGRITASCSQFDSDTTLYAKWTAITYKIHFDKNKPEKALNDVKGTMDDMILSYDQVYSLAKNKFSLDGFSFTGEWNTAADGTGDSYLDGQSVKNLGITQDDVITLYAQWDSNGPNDNTILSATRADDTTGNIIAKATPTSAYPSEEQTKWINSDAILNFESEAPGSGLSSLEIFDTEYGSLLKTAMAGSQNGNIKAKITKEGTSHYYGTATDNYDKSRSTKKSMTLKIDKTAPKVTTFSVVLGSYSVPLTDEVKYNPDGTINSANGTKIPFTNADGTINSKAYGARVVIQSDDWNGSLVDSHDVSKIRSASLTVSDADDSSIKKVYPITVLDDGTIDYETIINVNEDLTNVTRLRFTLSIIDNAGNETVTDYPLYAPDRDEDDETVIDRGIFIKTSIKRTTEADGLQTNQFRGGYSGVLHITTTGWVDTVTLDWPQEILDAAGIDIEKGQPHMDYNVTIDMNPETNPDVVASDSTGFTRSYDFKFWVPIYINDVIHVDTDDNAMRFDVEALAVRVRNKKRATATAEADLLIGGKNIIFEFRSTLTN